MDIISALFVENFNIRQVPGPSTRIDLDGVMFSMVSPLTPPVEVNPHLVVLIRCRLDEPGAGALEVSFKNDKGEQVARNVSPFNVEPGKFTYRLIKAELRFETYSTLEAHCRIGLGDPLVVPLTLIPAIEVAPR